MASSHDENQKIEIAVTGDDNKTAETLLVHIEMLNEPQIEEKVEETDQETTKEDELEHKYNDNTVELQSATSTKNTKRFLKRQDTLTTELKNKFTASADLPLPYKKNNCCSTTSYYLKSLVVTNPRLFSAYLLYSSIWPRLLVLVDMYTDFIVAKDLYDATSNEKQIESLNTKESAMLFMLTCVFILFPFVMVWTASLRFVHRYLVRDYKHAKHYKCTKITFNIFLMLYLFPPVGCLLMSLLEIYWVFYDIIRGVYHFFIGKILIINTDPQIKAIKEFRKVIEFFGESFPQLILQLYIFKNGSNYVDAQSLIISICISAFSFAYNLYKLYSESRIHGMTLAEYALSLLQLSEIPIIKLVPRLPAIRNGLTDLCNFAHFDIDKESLGPIIDALSDTRCKLSTMKLSIDSLSYLDDESLTMLGGFLYRKDLKIIVSQTAHPEMILKLFRILDTNNNGYLRFEQFQKLLSFAFHDEEIQKKLFENLAIRRIKQRDRIYFYDFYESIAGYKSKLSEYDFGIIEYPLHWIIKYCTKLYQHCAGAVSSDILINFDVDRYDLKLSLSYAARWKIVLNKLLNLYYFAVGSNYDLQFDETDGHIHNNIFFTIADALNTIVGDTNDDEQVYRNTTLKGMAETKGNNDIAPLIQAFIWKICWLLLKKTNAAQTIDELNSNETHVLSYCVERNQWRLFTILLHYSLLHGNHEDSALADFINLDKMDNKFADILSYALDENLEEPVKYLLNKYGLDKVLFAHGDYANKKGDELLRSRVWRLFKGIFQSRMPSVSMVKLLFELLDAQNTQLLTKIMLNNANLLHLAIRFRIRMRDKDKRSAGATLDAIKAYCIQQILEIEDDALATRYIQEEYNYQSAMLDIIALLVSMNSKLSIDLNVAKDSPISLAIDRRDNAAVKSILQHIEEEDIEEVLCYKYEQYQDQNIFSLAIYNRIYDVAYYLIEKYVHKFNAKAFNDATLVTENPYYSIFREYLYYLTNENAKNGEDYEENISALYSMMTEIAQVSVIQHISDSMSKKFNEQTYTTIETLSPYIQKKQSKPYTISAKQCQMLLNHWKAYKGFVAKGSLDDDPGFERRDVIHKILILGVGATGKATLFKHLRYIHSDGFRDEEYTSSAKHIQDSIINQMKNILMAFADENDIVSVSFPNDLAAVAQKVRNISPEMPLSAIWKEIKQLWAHEVVQKAFADRSNLGIADCAEFFFNDIERLSANTYRPTKDDILLARIPTTGIRESRYQIGDNKFSIYQVGSQRSERYKWIHCFDRVHAVLYVASLSDFDQYLYESHTGDTAILTMHEQLNLFYMLLECRYLRHASFILYLNKEDLFRQKIKKGKSLKICFPDYDGEDGDIEYGIKYIREQFLAINTNANRQIYTHVTCNIDTENVTKVFNDVHHIVVNHRLQTEGLFL